MRSRGTTRKRLRKKFPPSLEDQNLQELPRSGVRGRYDRPYVAKWIFSIRSFKTPLLSVVSGDQENCPQDCETYRESVYTCNNSCRA